MKGELLPFTFDPTPRQWQAWQAVMDPAIREVGYGGAKGGGKSFWLCAMNFILAWGLMSRFKLPQSGPPIHVGWMGRKRAIDFVQTTLQTWQRHIPSHTYELKAATEKHPRHILIRSDIAGRGCHVALDYGGLDSRIDINKFNSAEYMVVSVDQVEETTRDDVSVLMGSRRLTINGQALDYKGLWTANPAACWFKDDFIDYPDPSRKFIQALYKDNPYLPGNYVRTLEDAFSYRPDLLHAYRDGDWSSLSGIDQIILAEWITAARWRLAHQSYIKRLVSVDPARFGDDLAVILGLENTRIVGACILPQCSATDLAHEAHAMALQLGNCPIVVESVGTDGTSDILAEQGARVIRYCPSDASTDQAKYFNKRAEVWATVAKWFCHGVWDKQHGMIMSLPEADERFDEQRNESPLWEAWHKVTKQLTWPKYKFRGERILVQPKEEIKEEHEGVSPDFADAYVNGLYHLPMVETVEVRERAKMDRSRRKPSYRYHPMSM